jgi:hypothetical protein
MISKTRELRAMKLVPLVSLIAKPTGKLRFVVESEDGIKENHMVWCTDDLVSWYCDCRWMSLHPGDMCSHSIACLLYMTKPEDKVNESSA